MRLSRVLLPIAVLTVAFVSTAHAEEQRGFFYPGFRPTENPFAKAGRHYWVSPGGDDRGPGSKATALENDRARTARPLNPATSSIFFRVCISSTCQFGPAGPSEDSKTVFRAVDPTLAAGRVVITANQEFTPPSWSLSDNLSLQGLWIGGAIDSAHKSGGGSYTSRNSEIVGCTFFNAQGFAGGPAYNWLFQDNRMVHQGRGHPRSQHVHGWRRSS